MLQVQTHRELRIPGVKLNYLLSVTLSLRELLLMGTTKISIKSQGSTTRYSTVLMHLNNEFECDNSNVL